MSVSVTYTSNLTTVEQLTTNIGHQTADHAVTSSGLNTSLSNQGGASNPPATLRAGADKALSSGTGSLDMTALVGTNGVAVDGTGLRVQFAKFVNPATNANPITISKGASNGYDGFGAAFSLTLVPGMEQLVRLNDAGSDIGSGNKVLDLVGTASQALSYEIVLG